MNRAQRGTGLPLLVLVTAVLAAPLHAQTWQPQRHVEISSPGGAGGALDTTARITDKLMQEMKLLPVSSTVVNRSGGEHAMAYNHIRQRTGDPHQLSFASPVLLANHIAGVLPVTYTDVTPIGCLISEYYVFAVRAESPIKSGRDFVEGLKASPETYSVAVGTLLTRIAAGLALQAGNVDLKKTRMVVFAGAAKQTMTVLGGHMDVAVTPLVQVLPHFEAGTLHHRGDGAEAASGRARVRADVGRSRLRRRRCGHLALRNRAEGHHACAGCLLGERAASRVGARRVSQDRRAQPLGRCVQGFRRNAQVHGSRVC